MSKTFLTHLKCSRCSAVHSAGQLQNLCSCGAPLLACYDLAGAARTFTRESLRGRRRDLWRYQEVLPGSADAAVTLGEGGTPLLPLKRLGERHGCPHLYLKDESFNPTGTFKARGMAAAVSQARALGARKLAVPTAGNAGGALAAYASRAGLEAYVLMPKDAPQANQLEVRAHGAHLILVDGLIGDCGRIAREGIEPMGWFDMSTLKEPYRIEGKKTMGLELAQQLDWTLPDAIFYPTGGGTGLIGMWKAFQELVRLGWISGVLPRMVAVQATGCAPIVLAFESGAPHAERWENAATLATGIRVPSAIGDFLILEALRASNGFALAVDDQAIDLNRKNLVGTNLFDKLGIGHGFRFRSHVEVVEHRQQHRCNDQPEQQQGQETHADVLAVEPVRPLKRQPQGAFR
ncbi:MAG: threonine synthase [Acidobacteria bacterium]|nr:threonine synthase [Acidobacteriota bacterium]